MSTVGKKHISSPRLVHPVETASLTGSAECNLSARFSRFIVSPLAGIRVDRKRYIVETVSVNRGRRTVVLASQWPAGCGQPPARHGGMKTRALSARDRLEDRSRQGQRFAGPLHVVVSAASSSRIDRPNQHRRSPVTKVCLGAHYSHLNSTEPRNAASLRARLFPQPLYVRVYIPYIHVYT